MFGTSYVYGLTGVIHFFSFNLLFFEPMTENLANVENVILFPVNPRDALIELIVELFLIYILKSDIENGQSSIARWLEALIRDIVYIC